MAKLFANSGDPDQTPRSAASDQGLHCLSVTISGSPDHSGLTMSQFIVSFDFYFIKYLFQPASVAQLDARPTGDQEVAGSTSAEVGNIL